jgi:hypothetical protein
LDYIVEIKHCFPRPEEATIKPQEERPRTPWTFEVAVFREYRGETASLVDDCFEFDWMSMKRPKLKKSSEAEVKQKLKELYPFIREIYRRLAAASVVSILFAVGWNIFREFMTSTLNITDNRLKPDDCDRLFIGVNASGA